MIKLANLFESKSQSISARAAKLVARRIGMDLNKIDLEQFRRGLEVELEHGTVNPATNITDDDMEMTGKIAWAHLNELPDYYTRLDKMENTNEEHDLGPGPKAPPTGVSGDRPVHPAHEPKRPVEKPQSN